MRKPAKRRSSHFEPSGLPGLETRRLLSADFPLNYAEMAESHRPEEPIRFDDVREFDLPPKPAMISMRAQIEPVGRKSDSMLVRPAFDAFRQIPGGSDRFATTVGDSLSVKFGTPIGSTSQAGSTFQDSAGAAWSAPADIETTTQSGVSLPTSTGSSISLEYASFEQFFRVPLTVRINSSMQVNSNSFSKSDRMGPAPLIVPSSPSLLLMVSPDASSTLSASATANQSAARDKPGKSYIEISQTPNRSQPQGNSGDSGASPRSIYEESEFTVVPLAASCEETVSAKIRQPSEAQAWILAPTLSGDGSTHSDSVAKDDAPVKPEQPPIWSRISEAFGIDDSDFSTIGTEPLDEPVEVDTDELSAAVDRIIDGFAQPVEDSSTGPQLGKTIGMAAGVAIAIQIYVRRRRTQDGSTTREADDRSELRTHVSPELDHLNESD